MIDANVYEFLSLLKENNSREWFADNKDLYEQAKFSFETSIDKFIKLVHKIDPSVGKPAAKDCVFRIYRDTRFSADKTPYKTNMGGFVVQGGRKSPLGGYYLHVEPGRTMIAGGVWQPPADVLRAVRKEVFNFADEFKQIIHDKEFVNVFGGLHEEDKLKNPPKGFPKDFKDVDLLKYKSYTVGCMFKDDELTDRDADKKVAHIITVMEPFNSFLNRGIQSPDEELEI